MYASNILQGGGRKFNNEELHNLYSSPDIVTIKITMFWNVTPCSLIEVQRCFGGTYCSHLHGRRVSQAVSQQEADDTGPHGVISRKMVLFIVTAVRTLNPLLE
jgi:hypothetical protein